MIQEEHRYNPLDGDSYAAAHTQASPALRSEALRVAVPHTLVLFCFSPPLSNQVLRKACGSLRDLLGQSLVAQ